MSSIEQTEWPGQAAIDEKKRTPPWKYLLASIGLAVGGLLFIFFPGLPGSRVPWLFALIYNTFGSWGVVALFELVALCCLVAAIRGFARR